MLPYLSEDPQVVHLSPILPEPGMASRGRAPRDELEAGEERPAGEGPHRPLPHLRPGRGCCKASLIPEPQPQAPLGRETIPAS